MKYSLITTIIILLFSIPTNAQIQEQETIEPAFIIKYVPTGLFNFYTPMLQFAGENMVASNLGLQYEVGILSPLIKPLWGNENAVGGRIKTEIRRYQYAYWLNLDLRQFWGLGIQAQQISNKYEQQFCVSGTNCNSTIVLTVHESVTEFSPTFSYGYQYFFDNNFMIEVSLLAGINRKWRYNALPRGYQDSSNRFVSKNFELLYQTAFYIGYVF